MEQYFHINIETNDFLFIVGGVGRDHEEDDDDAGGSGGGGIFRIFLAE